MMDNSFEFPYREACRRIGFNSYQHPNFVPKSIAKRLTGLVDPRTFKKYFTVIQTKENRKVVPENELIDWFNKLEIISKPTEKLTPWNLIRLFNKTKHQYEHHNLLSSGLKRKHNSCCAFK